MKPMVYVAGPISANPMGAVRNTLPVFKEVISLGGVPFMPQWSVIAEMVEHIHYDLWLAYDFDIIRHCDALLILPGVSPRVDREVNLAHDLNMPVFYHPADMEFQFPSWVFDWMKEHNAATPTR